MKCGTKCFIVTLEKESEVMNIEVPARSQVDARKMMRKEYGQEVLIREVRKK